jgi:N utilization substance protein A
LGEGLVEKLSAAGVTTVEALADMTPEQLEAIEGIGPKTVEKISLAVNNYFASLEQGEAVAEGEVAAEVASAEGEAVTEEAAPEAVAESESGEAAAEAEQAAVPDSTAATAEAAPDEKHEHEPEAGSAPETTE